ncbi:MAG TPA: HAMP domain-containing sensor histidine kinase, partial [Phycisphaerae bacterium]|nr:HAMP domain-containing sensor histidine kinase [Phycisphaerae bacterium]
GVAAALTVLLLLVYLSMIRRWLIRPVDVLRASVETIGHGDLAHRVPLAGRDELAVLARGIDGMAAGLAAHQAELVRAREFSAIGEMCANIAHGLRNPLAAIRSGAQLAARRANGSATVRESFDDLAAQADVMDQRISRLFLFSRPLELRATSVSFVDLAASAHAQARNVLTTRDVRLTIDDATNGRGWCIDAERVAEAVAELIMNAAHHSPPQSEVRVHGAADIDGAVSSAPDTSCPEPGGPGTLRIEVIDRGAGMSPATCAKAFDTFFTTRPGGTGMGLALVRKLAKKHGGTVSIESQPNAGTTITLTLRELPQIKAGHATA